MGKKIAVAVVAGLLAAGVWWIVGHEVAPPSLSAVPRTSAESSLASVPSTLETSRSPTGEERNAVSRATQSAEADPYGSLDIQVVWHDGTPAAGVGLEQLSTLQTTGRTTRWRSDAAGRIAIARIAAGTRAFLVDRWSSNPHLGRFEVTVLTSAHNHLRVVVSAGLDVRGRVVDSRGEAVAGAELWSATRGPDSPYLVGHSAEGGSFFIRSLPPNRSSLYAKAERRGISSSVLLPETSSENLEVELRLSPTTAELAGRVLGAKGEPISDADVVVTLDSDTSVGRKVLSERTQPDGSFQLAGLCRSSVTVEVAGPEYPLWATHFDLSDQQSKWLDVQLQEGVTVVGNVSRSDNAPCLARIEWAENGRLTYVGELAWKRVRCSVNTPGEYRLSGLPPGSIRLEAQGDAEGGSQGRASTTLSGSAGETLRWDIDLEVNRGEIVGRVVDQAGQPQMGWWVDAQVFGVKRTSRASERTDDQGRFIFKNCPDVDHLLRLQWPHKMSMTQVAESELVRPGAAEVLFVVSPGMVPTAALVGTVLDDHGVPIEGLSLSAEDELGRSHGRGTYESNGRFQVELLMAGRYRLTCCSNRLCTEPLGWFEVGPAQVLDVGSLRLSPRGFLEVTIRRSDGVVLTAPMSRIVGEGAESYLLKESTEDGVLYRSQALVPGRYFIYPDFANAGGPMREVEIRPGETTSLAMELEPAARRVLRFRVPTHAQLPKLLTVRVVDSSGALFLESDGRFDRDSDGRWAHILRSSFPVGIFRFEAKSAEGLAACGTIEIAPESQYEGLDIELTKQP